MSQRTTGHISKLVEPDANKEVTVIDIKGPGENLFLLLYTSYYETKYTILIDNIPLAYGRFNYIRPTFIHQYQGDPEAQKTGHVGGPGIWLTVYDSANDAYGIIINLPLKWKISLVIKVEIPAADKSAQVSMIYDQLEEIPTLEKPREDLQVPTKKHWWEWPF